MTVPRLTAAQAAARLGVKPQTLYAYVSRGLLSRERSATGSTFDPLEVEAFARRRRPSAPASTPRTSRAAAAGSPLMVLDTDIALIEDDELIYRGRPAAELALTDSVEKVAAWLWGLDAHAQLDAHPDSVAAARRAVTTLAPAAPLLSRVQAAVVAMGAADPLRHDPSEANLRRIGAELLVGVPRALAPSEPAAGASVAESLWTALAGRAPEPAGSRAISAALVLAVDHDLAASTLAARVAASARADGYAVVSAALGAFDSALHGDASRPAAELLARVVSGEAAETAIAAAVRDGGRGVPGFGQPLYRGTDARARALLPLVGALPGAAPVTEAAAAIAGVVEARAGLHPNFDFALAVLTGAAGMAPDAGSAVFAVGRTVGWIAHALDEYRQRPLRLRPRGRYVGP
ncbi:citrate synthase [Gryllotalpicola ginsengisoli]|uniref:citrate synthase n=1 Tax=Gryllotalpicola ginsengisoli TaxID=444608 RepID=UPI0003B3224D|nr:citrate synthase [Gryllotalpicola ginsengisoli]